MFFTKQIESAKKLGVFGVREGDGSRDSVFDFLEATSEWPLKKTKALRQLLWNDFYSNTIHQQCHGEGSCGCGSGLDFVEGIL